MKTIFLAHIGLIFLSFILYINATAQVKTAVIGNISTGQPVISDMNKSKEVLAGSLSSTAIPYDIRIFYQENEKTYYLSAKVSNDPVKFIAIEMQVQGSQLSINSGPGYEILCLGIKCENCISKSPKGNPVCFCADPNPVMDCSAVIRETIIF